MVLSELGRPLVLFAMKEEAAPFLDALAEEPSTRIHRHGRFLTADGPEIQCTVLVSGPGELNTLEALSELQAEWILHAGFAGSLLPGWERGKVVRVQRVRCATEVLEVPPISQQLTKLNLPEASLVTLPGPANRLAKERMKVHGAGDLVDMESFYVVRKCQQLGIPYFGLRVISDGVEEDLPQALVESWDGRKFSVIHLLVDMIFQPSLLPKLLKLRRQAKESALCLRDQLLPLVRRPGLRSVSM